MGGWGSWDDPLARATRGFGRMRGSGQVSFLLAERAHSESARSMRAVKDRLDHSLQERCKEKVIARCGIAWEKARLGAPGSGG